MNQFLVSQELMQKIGNYLVGRPYVEVADMIDAIKLLKAIAPSTDVTPLPESANEEAPQA
jgi:hypothetical protein